MNCANCGAGLNPVSNRNYFRCPYCETFHFPQEMGDGVAVLGGEARFDCPVWAYQVSGEYAMVRAAADAGHLEERRAALEALTAIKRAGAGTIVTYWAKDLAGWL